VRVRAQRYGEEAFEALAEELSFIQRDDVLRRATVVVERGQVGLAARRRLAARPGGVVNVRFLTLPALAAELARGDGRLPVTRAVEHEAARGALATAGGVLSRVREQPATTRALVRTYGELRGVPETVLLGVATKSERAAEVIRLVSEMKRRMTGFYDEIELMRAAADAGSLGEVGPVIVYLLSGAGPGASELLEALDAAVGVTSIVGFTGDPIADAGARELVARWGGLGAGEPAGLVEHGTRVLVAPAADSEVLLAVRRLMGAHADGTPMERLALVHSGIAPYPRLVRDVLIGAGIPFNGAGVRPLSASVAGRCLLGCLSLPDKDWRRDEVTAWMACAPLETGVPASAWDVLSAEAGVVAGMGEWRTRLRSHAATLRRRAAASEDGVAFAEDAGLCDRLLDFVVDLGARLAAVPDSWREWSRWAKELLSELLGTTACWPVAEVAALDAVLLAVEGLAVLGDGRPGPSVIREALAAELESPAPQTTRFGHGLFVGRIEELVGLHFDMVWVLGMVDGAVPSRSADDVLLPDSEREPQIPVRSRPLADSRRDYLAALASGADRTLSYPVGDPRQGRTLRPSSLLLETAGILVAGGRRIFARDQAGICDQPGYRTVPSYAAAVTDGDGEPLSPSDWDLRSMARWTVAGGDLMRHFRATDDPILRAGLALSRGRNRATFSRYDGRVEGVGMPSPAGGAVLSATGLERYARCPRSYFFEALGARVRQFPETALRIDPTERGTIVHRALERFFAEALDHRPAPGTSWGAAGERRLMEIAATLCEALWPVDRAVILGDLRHFLREDDRYRRRAGATPEAVETTFGMHGQPPLRVGVPDGRQVLFRGTIDRVDRMADGGLGVLDYKTGRRPRPAVDPVAGGTRLQLPVYALAARSRFEANGPIEAHYWYVGDREAALGHYRRDGFVLDEEVEARFTSVVGSMVEGIEGGVFPGNPSGCQYCDYQWVCPADRARAWERKLGDPWVSGYRRLGEPE